MLHAMPCPALPRPVPLTLRCPCHDATRWPLPQAPAPCPAHATALAITPATALAFPAPTNAVTAVSHECSLDTGCCVGCNGQCQRSIVLLYTRMSVLSSAT